MNIQLQILKSLRRVHPRMLPMETLWAEVRMAAVPQPDRPSFDEAIRALEDEKKQIVVTRDDDSVRVLITAPGIARHQAANS